MATQDHHAQQVNQLIEDLYRWAGKHQTPRQFLETFDTRNYSSQAISDVLVQLWAGGMGSLNASEAYRQAMQVMLDRALTTEHIAAQQRMTAAADKLQKAAWGLALASFIVAAAQLYLAIGKN